MIISPIETIVDWCFTVFYHFTSTYIGVIGAVVGVSLCINFLALPLYNIADSLQEKERKIAKKLEYRVKRIRKGFKGDEQFMMLQEYYRQNNYHPLYVLRSSLSILIEIPFFIAAYHYLSNCELLLGESFWIFKDLGSPDSMFKIPLFGKVLVINVLPILMTLINFVSGYIYTKEAPAKEKIQLYVVAMLFLVLLYNSPAGLVIYWILNNLFSLVKNVVMQKKNPGKILYWILCGLLVIGSLFLLFFVDGLSKKIKLIFYLFTILFIAAAFILKLIKKSSAVQSVIAKVSVSVENKKTFPVFIFSAIGVGLLLGLLLPANVISSSPIEFSFLGSTDSPMNYIWTCFCFFVGFCVVWPFAIYKMFGEKIKKAMPVVFFLLFVTAIFNIFVFKPSYGKLNYFFTLEDATVLNFYPMLFVLLPVVVLIAAVILYQTLARYNKTSILTLLLVSLCVGELALGSYKCIGIKKVYKQYVATAVNTEKQNTINTTYHLSKDKQNVIVLFMDRCINSFFPSFLQDFPEYEKSYEGFVLYPNTVSFGAATINGFPPLAGGYEYTPKNNNQRTNELLVTKHNEATLVMPKLFLDGGYDVTFTDPSWPNYELKGDLSAFEPYPQMHVSEEIGKYYSNYLTERNYSNNQDPDNICRKQIRNFSILQALYPPIRVYFYKTINEVGKEDKNYLLHYSSLYYLDRMTAFDNQVPTFSFIENETCHNPLWLDENFELPVKENYGYKGAYKYTNENDLQAYEVNVAAFIQIAKYLDYLRENGVYDNTRIIVVSDHGAPEQFADFRNFSNPVIPSAYNPMLMVKDFNSNNALVTDNTFMTNADTLFFAKEGLGLAEANPFTGKTFETDKTEVLCGMFLNEQWNATYLKKSTQFDYSQASCYTVKDNIYDENNWKRYTFKEEK